MRAPGTPAAGAAPRENVGPRPSLPPSGGGSRRDAPWVGKLRNQLEGLFAAVALGFVASSDPYCAQVVAERSPALIDAWLELAKVNPAVKRTLERMAEGSAWGNAAFATLSIALPIAQHHGMYPAEWPNPWGAITTTPLDNASKVGGEEKSAPGPAAGSGAKGRAAGEGGASDEERRKASPSPDRADKPAAQPDPDPGRTGADSPAARAEAERLAANAKGKPGE